jgi:hypothetical protein
VVLAERSVMALAALRASSLARGEQPVPPVSPPPKRHCSHGKRLWAAPAMSIAATDEKSGG